MKKFFCALLSTLLICSATIIPSGAIFSPQVDKTVVHEVFYLDDLEIETTTTIYPPLTRTSSVYVEREAVCKNSGVEIATVIFKVTFGYDGTTSWVEDTSSSHTTNGGWTYKNESITTSGGTATLTASLTKFLYPTFPVEISITCSPTGEIT